jgi:dTDP-4-dehydrorhamnose reductase
MKVLITGAAGQLGQALLTSAPPGLELIACSRSGGGGNLGLDLADAEACRAVVGEHRPDWLINAGAYTAVDKAESEPELAQAVNAGAPAAFAEALHATGGQLLQLSTDFVFNGAQGAPYRPEQQVDPLGIYGSSKAHGEAAALQLAGARVLRTSWVYGPLGKNFLLTMLRLMGEREQLGVVADQLGSPTSTNTLAAACWRAIGVGIEPDAATEMPRILHYSDAGAASWYDFAVAIAELGQQLGLLLRAARVMPISTADYPTAAKRPSYSLLDCSASRQALGLQPLHWREALINTMKLIRLKPC